MKSHHHAPEHKNNPVFSPDREMILKKYRDANNALGVVRIGSQIHDDAIVISGSLSMRFIDLDIYAVVSEALEAAARDISMSGGIVGHIKASVTTTSITIISTTGDNAMSKESPVHNARIIIAAIVFQIDPQEAQNKLKKSLKGIRARLSL